MKRLTKRVVLVVVVLALFAVGLQTVVYFEVRGSAASAAADAARDAAANGGNVRGAAAQAERRIRDDVDDADAAAITCTSVTGTDPNSGLDTVTVRCQGKVRLLLTHRASPLTVDESSTVIRPKG